MAEWKHAAPTWLGAQLQGLPGWRQDLETHEVLALQQSVDGAPPALLADALGERLARIQLALESGPGAVLVRGLPATEDEAVSEALLRAFAGGLGSLLSQNDRGERLLRVEDAGYQDGDPRLRGPFSARSLRFHTDRCDVIAFLCVRPAANGGSNHLIASRALRERMAERHPGLLEVLERPFPYLRHTIDPGNQRPWVELPIFSSKDGAFACCLLRVLIDRAHADPHAPNLDAAQVEALDTLEREAEDPALRAQVQLRSGDLLLVNNWTILHRRTAFQDAAGARRLLLRAWISTPCSRPVDERFASHFGATAAGALRGGIWPAGAGPGSGRVLAAQDS